MQSMDTKQQKQGGEPAAKVLERQIWQGLIEALRNHGQVTIDTPHNGKRCAGTVEVSRKHYRYEAHYDDRLSIFHHKLTSNDGSIVIKDPPYNSSPPGITYENKRAGIELLVYRGFDAEYQQVKDIVNRIYAVFTTERDERLSQERSNKEMQHLMALQKATDSIV